MFWDNAPAGVLFVLGQLNCGKVLVAVCFAVLCTARFEVQGVLQHDT
jgi:hypothetical protein